MHSEEGRKEWSDAGSLSTRGKIAELIIEIRARGIRTTKVELKISTDIIESVCAYNISEEIKKSLKIPTTVGNREKTNQLSGRF